MKKMFSFLALFSACLNIQQGSCDYGHYDGYYVSDEPLGRERNTYGEEMCDDGCYACKEPIESPPLYVHSVPSYSYRMKCVEKEVPVRKIACRPVQREYQVQRVRYVPQCYTETITRTEMEYYYVNSVDIRQDWICEKTCEYTPEYYRKPCQEDEDSMAPRCKQKRPISYPKPFGCKECP